MNERVAIYGGHNLPEHVRQQVRERVKALKPGDTLVTTDEPGVGHEARAAARDLPGARHNLILVEVPCEWGQFGIEAPDAQSTRILGLCDRAVIFWDMVNPRVRDFINYASSVPHEVINYVTPGALK